MINRKKVMLVSSRINAAENYKHTKNYAVMFVFTSILILFFLISSSTSLSLFDLYLRAVLSFILVFGILSSVLFIVNEIMKMHSIMALDTVISCAGYNDWDLEKIMFIRNPELLHPYIISNPIMQFFIGNYFVREGYKNEGNMLIDKAILKKASLRDISIEPLLNAKDAEYLIQEIQKDERLKVAYNIKNFLSIKKNRYLIGLFLSMFVLVHLIVQFTFGP